MYLPKTNSIFLLGSWHSLDVKRYGYNKLLALLFKQLQELESEKGLLAIAMQHSATVMRCRLSVCRL